MTEHIATPEEQLFSSVKELIEKSKKRVAASINSEITLLYWNVVININNNILSHLRANYGQQSINKLSKITNSIIWQRMEQETSLLL